MTSDTATSNARAWRTLQAVGLAVPGFCFAAMMVITQQGMAFAIITLIFYLALGAATYRWIDRGRVALATAALGLVGLLSSLTFLLTDLSHPDTWTAFAPDAVGLAFGLAGVAAGFTSFFRPARSGARLLGLSTAAIAILLAVTTLTVSLTAPSVAAEVGDVEVVAKDIEYPETLTASAGLVGFHITNDDPFRHSFVIEGTDVKLELPGSKARRVEVELAPGQYHYVCDVYGHDRMEGTLTVR